MIKQFFLTHKHDPNRYSHSRSEWSVEQWRWRGTSHSPNTRTRLLPTEVQSHIQYTCWERGSYSSAEMPLVYSTAPANWADFKRFKNKLEKQFTFNEFDPHWVAHIGHSSAKPNDCYKKMRIIILFLSFCISAFHLFLCVISTIHYPTYNIWLSS